MKKIFFLFCLVLALNLSAQTGIGTTTPNASAKLDVYSTNKGFLPPRVTLTSETDATTIASPAEGLLVYNLGSVGLQAGYYYWNGANWATIATATSAGNGVTSSDLVKLYAKAYSTASGDIANASGYSFTVPVSGRYLFDFSCTAYSSNTEFTQYFKVRQGTTDLATDAQTVTNNGVRVEYNGKLEVNLQSGVTYNVYVTGGARNGNDYDRVYMKLVSGNLPVTGQSVDYVSVSRTGSDQTVNTGSIIIFNTNNGGNIPYNTSTGAFSLTAGKTYKLISGVSISNGNSTAKEVNFYWKNAAGDILGSKGEMLSPNANVEASGNGIAYAIYTPTINTTVSVIVSYSTASTILWQNYTFASIEQIGSSAIVNPWVLSGNDVYNTTGDVGIGTNNPNAKLDVTGDVNVTGKINVSDATGNVITKISGFVNAGNFLILDNLKATIASSGNRGLCLATVSGSFICNIAGTYGKTDGGSGSSARVITYNTTVSNSAFGWHFGTEGDMATYIINDTTNTKVYRVIIMIGYSFNNNFISIERLL